MTEKRSVRGQPLFALAAVLGSWVAVRAVMLDVAAFIPASPPDLDLPRHVAANGHAGAPAARKTEPGQLPERLELADVPDTGLRGAASAVANWLRTLKGGTAHTAGYPVYIVLAPLQPQEPAFAGGSPVLSAPGDVGVAPVRLAAAHQLLRMAALTGVPMQIDLASAAGEPAAAPFHPVGHEAPPRQRWSGDGWVLLRRGGNVSLATGGAPATYGASQAGAVLRYSLAPADGHKPAAYLRTTAALNGSHEREAALGLSARPLPAVPVVASVEMRATDQAGRTRLRPAAMVVTELPPFRLPLKTRGEAYAQAGYVGGKFATPFADGQLRVDREVVDMGKGEVRAGAGAWGGAQKGASRLDVGPGATMRVGIGDSASARVSVDWRFRVAGDAEPSSGPALTLSAGF